MLSCYRRNFHNLWHFFVVLCFAIVISWLLAIIIIIIINYLLLLYWGSVDLDLLSGLWIPYTSILREKFCDSCCDTFVCSFFPTSTLSVCHRLISFSHLKVTFQWFCHIIVNITRLSWLFDQPMDQNIININIKFIKIHYFQWEFIIWVVKTRVSRIITVSKYEKLKIELNGLHS